MDKVSQFRKKLGKALLVQGSLIGFPNEEQRTLVKAILGHSSVADVRRIEQQTKIVSEAFERLKGVKQTYLDELEKVATGDHEHFSRLANVYQYLDSSEFDESFETDLAQSNLTPEEADMFVASLLFNGPFGPYENTDLAIVVATHCQLSPEMAEILMARAIGTGSVELVTKYAEIRNRTLSEQQINALVFACLSDVSNIEGALQAAKLGCGPDALNMIAFAMLSSPHEEDVEEWIKIADGVSEKK